MTTRSETRPTMLIPGAESRHLAAPEGSDKGYLRFLEAGSGGAPVVLLHTVRTQAEHFHRLIPLLADDRRVIALDFPGMGHSEIVDGAEYDEPAFRAAVVRLLIELDLTDVTLVGESIGAVVALSVAADMPGRIRKVVAVNPYDYKGGIKRSSALARFIVSGILSPGLGAVLAGVEPRDVMKKILHGGLGDTSALSEDYLDELLSVGKRPGYSRVARAVYGILPSMIAARDRYADVRTPVELVYGQSDWSRESDRAANATTIPGASLTVATGAGHFLALERPHLVAALAR